MRRLMVMVRRRWRTSWLRRLYVEILITVALWRLRYQLARFAESMRVMGEAGEKLNEVFKKFNLETNNEKFKNVKPYGWR